ncbi:50S ribosomal protein L25/general stress protein Ctc [Leifsonia sp. H3M29-4]|uniref:50S ribosomal protein L25/general stress protein Ctc n=1 Tax=Salinibacterium metalliresistens TaxID=3031321 RepID=UPI0023D9BBD4|nr:50S ribosomal protein L25/general stress protein Ctc [Salinibacterium metalliresistens]MDF1479425.1 50S ribosomal protein L25/general stress protein Ctc [Salinibacterium metalliresistens]
MADISSNHLVTEIRDNFGKGAARKIRALGKIPAVIYGHGSEPQHVTLPGHETSLILRKSNQVLELDIQGKVQLALVKDVQKDPVRQIIEHIDLIVVRKGEKVTVDVPVHIEGEPVSGTSINQDANTISLEVEATHIPENIVVSVEGLGEGSHILAGDVKLPTGATLITDPETLIVGITGETAQDLGEETESAEEGAAEESAAEAATEGAE